MDNCETRVCDESTKIITKGCFGGESVGSLSLIKLNCEL